MDPMWPMEGLKEVIISSAGIFKYILIQVYVNEHFLGYLVRGDSKHEYHSENFKAFQK